MKKLISGLMILVSVSTHAQSQLSDAPLMGIVSIQSVRLVSTFFNPEPSSPFEVAAEAQFAVSVIASCESPEAISFVDVTSLADMTTPHSVFETVYVATQVMVAGLDGGCEYTALRTVRRPLNSSDLNSAKVSFMSSGNKAYRFTMRVENNQLNVFDDNGRLVTKTSSF